MTEGWLLSLRNTIYSLNNLTSSRESKEHKSLSVITEVLNKGWGEKLSDNP